MADKNHILKKFFYDRISVLLCNLGMLKDKTERKLTGPTEARKFKFCNQIDYRPGEKIVLQYTV